MFIISVQHIPILHSLLLFFLLVWSSHTWKFLQLLLFLCLVSVWMGSTWSETQDVWLRWDRAKHVCYPKYAVKRGISAKLPSFWFILILQLLQVSLPVACCQLEDSNKGLLRLFVFDDSAWISLPPSPVSQLSYHSIIYSQPSWREITFTNQLQILRNNHFLIL